MATIDQILARKWPGCIWTCRTTPPAITWWSDTNEQPEPSVEEVMAYSDEVDVYLRRFRMNVTPLQFRLALDAAGLLDECEAVVAAAPRSVQLSWEYAVTIERLNPFIDQFAAVINKTPEEVDAIFEAAAQIG